MFIDSDYKPKASSQHRNINGPFFITTIIPNFARVQVADNVKSNSREFQTSRELICGYFQSSQECMYTTGEVSRGQLFETLAAHL